MAILHAILLGIIEGLTEFLPISSTGHLIVAEQLIGFKDAAELFTVVIQIGAIAAVVVHYRQDLWNKIAGFFKKDPGANRFWLNLVIATVPAGLFGLALDKTLQKYATPLTVAISLIIGGVVLWAVEQFHKGAKQTRYIRNEMPKARLDEITPRQALGVGAAQVVSLIPGASRSGSTIVGGLLVGLDRVTATAFSFYLSIPVMVMATGYKLLKEHDAIGQLPGGAPALLAGTIAAFATGLFAINWLLRYVSRHDFKIFAYYRICVGALIILLLVLNVIG